VFFYFVAGDRVTVELANCFVVTDSACNIGVTIELVNCISHYSGPHLILKSGLGYLL